VYLKLHQYYDAIIDCSASIQRRASVKAYARRATAWMALQEYEKAVIDYKKSLEFEPNNHNFLTDYAKCLDLFKIQIQEKLKSVSQIKLNQHNTHTEEIKTTSLSKDLKKSLKEIDIEKRNTENALKVANNSSPTSTNSTSVSSNEFSSKSNSSNKNTGKEKATPTPSAPLNRATSTNNNNGAHQNSHAHIHNNSSRKQKSSTNSNQTSLQDHTAPINSPKKDNNSTNNSNVNLDEIIAQFSVILVTDRNNPASYGPRPDAYMQKEDLEN